MSSRRACDDIGESASLDRLHEFPPGTSYEDALAQAGYDVYREDVTEHGGRTCRQSGLADEAAGGGVRIHNPGAATSGAVTLFDGKMTVTAAHSKCPAVRPILLLQSRFVTVAVAVKVHDGIVLAPTLRRP